MPKATGLGTIVFLTLWLAASSQKWVDPPPKYQCPENWEIYPCKCLQDGDDGLHIECSNTNLAAVGYAIKLIKPLIHTLAITNCNIEKMYGNIFTPLTLQVLRIEDTPIRDISDGTFDGISGSLKELYVRNTWLTRVPPAMKNLTKLVKLEIEASRIKYLPPQVFDGMSSLVDLKVSESEVENIHAGVFSGLRQLKRLSLYKNKILTFPKDTFKAQINLEYLDMSYNRFPKLEPHFFLPLSKLLWCNVSHNEIPDLSSRVFSRNSVLRVLHLDHNLLKTVDANSFRGMRFMRRLYMSDNQISRVGRGTFRSVSRIGTIDLARNNLTTVDFQMFADLRFIDTIDLAENAINEVHRESFKNIYLTKINLSHNALESLPEGAFRGCENMTFLDLSHNQIRGIHPDAFDESSYTGELFLQFNSLTSLADVPMKNQKGIRILNVSHNTLEDIPKKTFPKLFELHTIDFSHNNISEIGRSVFSPLFSLRYLTFRHNKLKTLESSTFGKLPSLLEIDLSHNELDNVRRSVFSGFTSIRTIYMAHNQMDEIPAPPISVNQMFLSHNKIQTIKGRQPWPVMNSLIVLDLDYNELGDSIASDRFDNLRTLGTLKLRGNGLTRPPWEALQSLQSLRHVNLDDNLMTNLSQRAFGRLPATAEITLSGNLLNNISMNAFEGLLQIQFLDLSRNNLSFIPPGAFQSLTAVRILNLSHNHLEHLQNRTHGLFEDLQSLRMLDLSYNRIPFVTEKMFPENKWIPYRLEWLDLSHNHMPVLTKEILTGTKHLKHLNVSHNMLNDVRKGVLSNFSTLETLDISGNVLDDKIFLDGRFGIMANLTEFRLANNSFLSLPIEQLVEHKKLRLLDVRFNKLSTFNPDLAESIKLGLDVLFEGNALNCDCLLRPVVYWLISVGRFRGRAAPWDQTQCKAPKYLDERPVGSLLEEQLICEDNERANQYKLNPDIVFKKILPEGDMLKFRWSVNTNEDVADFRLELKTKSFPPQTLFQTDIGYSERYGEFVTEATDANLCILGKTSTGRVRSWRQQQCQSVRDTSSGLTSSPTTNWALLGGLVALSAYLWH
eukprot:maker-scaffold444_size168727-snap-gene-0.34 protein:Tk11359 transcript:maker-scaffold444_size168727-snap-gene-0.34-mRNA-1 annotation:"Chaoptin"